MVSKSENAISNGQPFPENYFLMAKELLGRRVPALLYRSQLFYVSVYKGVVTMADCFRFSRLYLKPNYLDIGCQKKNPSISGFSVMVVFLSSQIVERSTTELFDACFAVESIDRPLRPGR